VDTTPVVPALIADVGNDVEPDEKRMEVSWSAG
jgi:hypothetical protein